MPRNRDNGASADRPARLSRATLAAIASAASIACPASAIDGLRLAYDACGVRWVEWNASPGDASARVLRGCGDCPGGWETLEITTDTRVIDRWDPASSYRVVTHDASGAETGAATLVGDGAVAVNGRLMPSSIDPNLACGQSLTLSVGLAGATGPGFVWMRNGTVLADSAGASIQRTIGNADLDARYSVMLAGCPESEVSWPRLRLSTVPHQDTVAVVAYEKTSRYSYGNYCPGGGNQSGSGSLTVGPCNPSGTAGLSGGSFAVSAARGAYTCGCAFDTGSESWMVRLRLPGPTRFEVSASWSEYVPEAGSLGGIDVLHDGATVWSCRRASGDFTSTSGSCSQSLELPAGIVEFKVVADPGFPWCTSNSFNASASVSWTALWTDCNGNRNPDSTDVISGTSADRDADGQPDECQTVHVPADYQTIQAAIDAAPASQMRIVSVAAGAHAGPIDFLGKPVVVLGAGADRTFITGNASANRSVVTFSGSEPSIAALESVTVRDGATGSPFPGSPQFLVGGGIFGYQSAASVRDCVVERNIASFGAGAYFRDCTGTVERCTFRQNTAATDGGAIQCFAGAVSIVDCLISDNDCNSRGGGIHLVGGAPEVRRTVVKDNASGNIVGGISWVPIAGGGSTLLLDSVSVVGNSATLAQGGIGILGPSGDPSVATCSILGTTACGNLPAPNLVGPYVDLGANDICDCPADLYLDGTVNGADLGIVLAAWGSCPAPCAADIDGNGMVNGADLGLLLASWGPCGG